MALIGLDCFAGRKFSGKLGVKIRVELGKRCLVDERELEGRGKRRKLASLFVFGNYRERAMSEERGYHFLRVAGALACDPEFICYVFLLTMTLRHTC